jgi:hypothetical protein
MFVTTLSTIAKRWKQPRCHTTDEWIKKIWYLYTMEFKNYNTIDYIRYDSINMKCTEQTNPWTQEEDCW